MGKESEYKSNTAPPPQLKPQPTTNTMPQSQ
jgi:hypothetical protein